MLEKPARHDIQDVAKLFRLADKCTMAAKGRAWHAPPALEAGKADKHDVGATAQGSGNKNKN
jgi:hypothetical protein